MCSYIEKFTEKYLKKNFVFKSHENIPLRKYNVQMKLKENRWDFFSDIHREKDARFFVVINPRGSNHWFAFHVHFLEEHLGM